MKEGRSISFVCLMFQLYQSNTRAYRDASFRVPLPPLLPPPPNDIQRESGVDPGARFQRDTQSTMKRSRCCKRSAGIGMRVKSQLAAMERRRSVLIQFPGKTLLLKYFTIGGSVLHAWRGKVRAHSPRGNPRRRAPIELSQTPQAKCNLCTIEGHEVMHTRSDKYSYVRDS